MMKPGKPATFATVDKTSGEGAPTLVFALPGNPVSALVTFHLLAAPAIRRLQGVAIAECSAPTVQVRMQQGKRLDPERPEYHR